MYVRLYENQPYNKPMKTSNALMAAALAGVFTAGSTLAAPTGVIGSPVAEEKEKDKCPAKDKDNCPAKDKDKEKCPAKDKKDGEGTIL